MRRKVNLERDKNTDVVLSSAPLATEGKFKSKTTMRRSSKFKIVLRLSAQQCGKFMGAAIAGTVVWRRDAIERVSQNLAGAELLVRLARSKLARWCEANDSAAKQRRLLRR